MRTKRGGSLEQGVNGGAMLPLTRRGLLVGAAATAASASLAQEHSFDYDFWFEYADNQTRSAILLKQRTIYRSNHPIQTDYLPTVASVAIWPRRLFGDQAKFRIERRIIPSAGPPASRSWQIFELLISDCSFPSGPDPNPPRFSLSLILERDMRGITMLKGAFTPQWGDRPDRTPIALGGATGLPATLFVARQKDDARAKYEAMTADSSPLETAGVLLSDPIPRKRMNTQLLPRLFFERAEAEAETCIGFDLDMNLHIEAGPRQGRSIFVLDLPMAFSNLVVRRVFAEEPSSTGAAGGQPAQKAAAQLFEEELQSWRPPEKSLKPDSATPNPDITVGLSGTLFGLKLRQGRREQLLNFEVGHLKDKRMRIRALVDAERFPPPEEAGRQQNSRQDFSSAALTMLQSEIVAVLRHRGDPRMSLAGMRWQPKDRKISSPDGKVETTLRAPKVMGELQILHGSGTAAELEGPFPFRAFDIIRQRNRKGEVDMRFRFEPSAKETRINWQGSQLDVSALPPSVAAPGLAAQAPPITVEVLHRGDNDRELTDFRATFALHSVSIAMPERIDRSRREPEIIAGSHTSRLEFHDATASFFIPALENNRADPRANARLPLGPAVSGRVDALFDLDRATLRLSRAVDLLSLKYRFSGLMLWMPWRQRAGVLGTLAPPGGASQAGVATVARQRPPEDSQPRSDNSEPERPRRAIAAVMERRPLLVVDFPPQHVMEEAFFRQIPGRPNFPKLSPPVPGTETRQRFDEALTLLRQPNKRAPIPQADGQLTTPETSEDRKARRTEAEKRLEARKILQDTAVDGEANKDFYEKFRIAAGALPAEQRIYTGEEFLDPDAYAIAAEILAPADGRILAPDVDLPAATAAEEGKKQPKDDETGKLPNHESLTIGQARRLEMTKDALDPEYKAFRAEFANLVGATLGLSKGTESDRATYWGSSWYYAAQRSRPELSTPAVAALMRSFKRDRLETFPPIAQARLSGPTRIAFRVNTDDFEPERAGGGIPFSVEGLTNWASMDMAVVRRADNPIMMPERGAIEPRWARRHSKATADYLAFQGITPADAVTTRHEARRRQENLFPGPNKDTPPARRWGYKTVEQRMGEVYAAASQAPGDFETAIELPARLVLSPSANATWKTPSDNLRRIALRASSDDPSDVPTAGEDALDLFHELWTARLAETEQEGGVRAVWSPDFRPEVLLARTGNGAARTAAPPRGPYQPWAIPRSLSQSSDLTDIGQLARHHRFRTAMDAYDRHELVMLTSVHGLPVLGRRDLQSALVRDSQQIEPPDGYRLEGLKTTPPGPNVTLPSNRLDREHDSSAIYRPDPLKVAELSLSALGGTLDLNTDFQPPASATLRDGKDLFDAFSIERWRHKAVLGRDILVEIVYKGFLFPTGHPASLVKVTERRFVPVGKDGPTIAVLIQRKFLRFRKPIKDFPAFGQPNRGRRWPVSQLTLLTRQTPDLLDPDDIADAATGAAAGTTPVAPNGRIGLKTGNVAGLCFWPRTRQGDGGEFWFEMRVDKDKAPVRLPMIFVDNTAANSSETMAALVRYYNTEVAENAESARLKDKPSRHLHRGDQPVIMAPETKPGDTTFDTKWWQIKAEGLEGNPAGSPATKDQIVNADFARTAFLEGLDQPPFYPYVDVGNCRFTQIERFAGQGNSWRNVAYELGYVRSGFPGEPNFTGSSGADESEIYLTFVKAGGSNDSDPVTMDLGNAGDRSGGVAMPNMTVVGISRKLGPVGGNANASFNRPLETPPATAAQPGATPAPATASDIGVSASPNLEELKKNLAVRPLSFDKILGDGKLLGIVKLSEVLQVAAKSLLDDHPRLKETVDYGAAQLRDSTASLREILTGSVLRPAQKLVSDIRTEWTAYASRTVQVGKEKIGLDKAFPEIGSDLERLEGAVRASLAQGSNDADFLGSLSDVHEAGRRLIRTVDRIGRDPMAAISNDQLNAIQGINSELKRVAESFATLAKGRTLGQFGKEAVAQLLAPDPTGRALRRFMFELPMPPVLVLDNTRQHEKTLLVLQDSDAALREALEHFKVMFEAPNPSPEQVKAFLGRLVSNLPRNVDADVQGELEKIAKALAGATLDVLTSPAARAAAKVLGVNNVFEIPGRLDAIATELNASFKLGPDDAIRSLQAEFPTLLKAAEKWAQDLALRKLGAGANVACTKVHALVTMLIENLLPDPGAFDAIASCFGEIRNPPARNCTASTAAGLFSDAALTVIAKLTALEQLIAAQQLQEAQELRRRLSAARSRIGDASTDLARELDSIAKLTSALRKDFPAPDPQAQGCALPTTHNLVFEARLIAQRTKQLMETLKNIPPSLTAATEAMTRYLETAQAPFPEALRVSMADAAQSLGAFGRTSMLAFTKLAGRLVADDLAVRVPAEISSSFEPVAQLVEAHAVETAKLLRDEPNRIAAIVANNGDFGSSIGAVITSIKNLEAAPPANLAERVRNVHAALSALPGQVEKAADVLAATIQGQTLDLPLRLGRALTADAFATLGETDIGAPLNWIAPGARTVLDGLVGTNGALRTIDKTLTEVDGRLANLKGSNSIMSALIKALETQFGADSLAIVRPPNEPSGNLLRKQIDDLARVMEKLPNNQPDVVGAVTELRKIEQSYSQAGGSGQSFALVTLVKRFERVQPDLLRHVVVDALDLRRFRDELELLIRELVPTKIRLAYDLGTEMKPFRDILIPVAGQRLTLTMRTEIDLLKAGEPKFGVRGDAGRFQIRLFGSFHAVSLHFRGLTFTAGSGQSSDFKVNFERVEVGKDAKFLEQLQEYMSPKGGGLYIKPLQYAPGIDAGYGINLGTFGVGYLSFSNVTLNAGTELPFSRGVSALFKVSVGRSDAPFLISSTIFGGGGFLALIADPKGFVGLEGSFDFGGVFAFGFGPLNGSGQITVGVTFTARRGQSVNLGGVFMIRGQASIACFSIAASLVVRLRYTGGKMQGQATFTFSFSIGLGDIEYSVSVSNNQGSNLGTGESPGESQTASLWGPGELPPPTMFAEARGATASDASTPTKPPDAFLRTDTFSRRRDRAKFYSAYFVDVPMQEKDW